MLLKNISLSDYINLRLLQTKNFLTFTNLECANAGDNKILLFSIVRYKGKEGKREYIASYSPNTYIFMLNDKRFATYRELIDEAWEL